MAILATAAVAGEPVADAARRMSRTRAVLEPRPAMRAHLDEQYERLTGELRAARLAARAEPDPAAERPAFDTRGIAAGLNVCGADRSRVQPPSRSAISHSSVRPNEVWTLVGRPPSARRGRVLHRTTRPLTAIVAALALGAFAAPAQAATDPLLDEQWGLTDARHRRAGGLDAVARRRHPRRRPRQRRAAQPPRSGARASGATPPRRPPTASTTTATATSTTSTARTSRRSTATSRTTTATARTSPASSPRRPATAPAARASPRARRSWPSRCSTPTAPATRRSWPRASATRSTAARRSSTSRSTATARAPTSTPR